MEKENNNDINRIFDDSGLMSLVELQKFIADELATTEVSQQYSKVFSPITEGLGLESPGKEKPGNKGQKNKAPPQFQQEKFDGSGKPSKGLEQLLSSAEDSTVFLTKEPALSRIFSKNESRSFEDEKVGFGSGKSAESIQPRVEGKTSNQLASVFNGSKLQSQVSSKPVIEKSKNRDVFPFEIMPEKPIPVLKGSSMNFKKEPSIEFGGSRAFTEPELKTGVEPTLGSEVAPLPPPVPRPTLFQRILAGIIDQVFVLGMGVGVLLITTLVLDSGGKLDSLLNQSSFTLGRFVLLGFCTLWLGYLSVCVGLTEMTVGMWVWGLRFGYPKRDVSSRFLRKVMRIVCSFIFFAPVLPSLLLLIHAKGRNLLDLLSGSSPYRMAA